MIIYIDLVFLINFIMDFYILSGVKFILKLKISFIRLVMGTIIGSFTIFFLFFDLSVLMLNIIKVLISLLMVLVSFGKKNFFNKLFYLYIISIVLGGSLYLINDSLGYSVDSFIFINNGYSVNLIILLLFSPIIIYLYIKEHINYRKKINTIYSVVISLKGKEIKLDGFYDTGNKLVDPYFFRPIILVNKKYISLKGKRVLYVPFESLNNNGILKCIIPEYVLVNNKKYNKVLIGISDNLKSDCILNERVIDL